MAAFVFGSNLHGCLFHYRESLYRKWQQLGLSCVKVKEVVSLAKKLMALPWVQTSLIHSVFYELSPSVLEINVLDAMAMIYSNVENQWIQAMDPKMLSVHGEFRRANSEVEGFHSSFGKPISRKRPNFWFFLFRGIFRFGWDFICILAKSDILDLILVIGTYFGHFWRFRSSRNVGLFWSVMTFLKRFSRF